jgi:hypothetical protein
VSTSKQRDDIYSWGPFGLPIDYADELVRDIKRLREALAAVVETPNDTAAIAKAKAELERTK